MDQNPILKIKDLSFSYQKGEEILKGLNFELDERSTAIIGQNGAGKTTLVKLLKGLLRPTSGSIDFEGKDITAMTVAQLAKHIGMVFQNPNDQIFKNRVLDEVMFGPLKIGMDETKAKQKAMESLEQVGLLELADENPYDLGLSSRKLVAIASILAMDTKVIILDEPTIAQDYHGKELIKTVIRKLRAEGKTVITIIHDMDFVADTFERAIVVAHGTILIDGTTREVFAKEDILRQANLEQPNVTKLCRSLGYDEIFLTTDEFIGYQKEKLKA
ncbi:energy-coupling factor ABC transporter ATP-binding protein [Anaerocolumna chitinilytica]|uniref:ABC transporter ATP-binding protein n=1 Tax=Anaerocolumna chitinilytica TaxID=1727145 RepID=A0A7I8DKG8_9FIRM|nr:ABC transporter ATP-binding protein [Anaerocolumna chitinilytica]BCJ98879.1 ABC transporter ATP-binding protein [Anaerocolumna chitinilytica]